MSNIRIYMESNQWWVQDKHGTHPVTFQLGDVNWSLTDVSIGATIQFQFYDQKYRLELVQGGMFDIYQYTEKDEYVDELLLPPMNPFTVFFKKTGKHVKSGEVITIPIYHTFDKQLY